ncbi:MAG TPA: sugar ABC transporter permease, partial [Acidimicrobiales bacterium]|nr:sugar ABC transporter permease [Acidimicrobiales bacterium]
MRAGLADREGLLARLMLLPAIVYIVALVAVPFVVAIAYSFSDVTAGNPSFDWVGLDNYRANWNDPVFRRSLWNTFFFTAVTIAVTVVLANIVALLLTADFRGKWVVRFLVLLPWTTPAALGAIAWVFMLDSLLSPIDWILQQLGVLDDGRHMVWLGRSGLAKASVIGVQVWRLVPLAAVIIMAGQTAIPDDIND